MGWEDTIVSGWGTLSFGGVLSSTLQWVKAPPVSDATCNQPNSYDGTITANMICAGKATDTMSHHATPCQGQINVKHVEGLRTGGVGSCQGDSGGPLVSKATGVDTGYSLIGVVNFASGCALPNFYTAYAEVSYYLSWIAEQYGLSL